MEPTSKTASSPEACHSLYVSRLNDGDLDGLVNLYHTQGVHIRDDGGTAAGPEAIREVHRQFMGMKPNLDSRIVNVVEIGDDLAIVYDEWRLSAVDEAGDPLNMEGTGMHLLRSFNSGWKFIATGLTNHPVLTQD